MSFEPSQEDMLRADPNLGKQIIEQELAAVGKTIADISDEELGRRAREVGLDPDQMQSQFRFKRTPGKGIGVGFEKVKQRTAAQIIRGNQEPPPAFFEGIPEAMKQAIAGINRERVAEEVSTSFENIPDGIEDSAPNVPTKVQRLEDRMSSVAVGEAMLGSGIDRVEQMGDRPSNQKTDAERLASQLKRAKEAAVVYRPGDQIPNVDPIQPVTLESYKKATTPSEPASYEPAVSEPTVSEPTVSEPVVSEPEKQDAKVASLEEFPEFLDSLASSEELSRAETNAIGRLARDLRQRVEMGSLPINQVVEGMREDVRYKRAFNVIENIAEEDSEILENISGGLEILGAIPGFAPLGRTTQAMRAATKAIRAAPKDKTGRIILTRQRTNQDVSTGVVTTSERGGRTVARVQAVKTRAEPSRVPEGTVAGLRRIGTPGAKLPESTRKGVRGTVRPENLPSDKALGGKRKGVIFAIPYSSDSEKEIENSRMFQTQAINFIMNQEGFSFQSYPDVNRNSIGYGTAAKGRKFISQKEAMDELQLYLENEVYPEINYIQENTNMNLNPEQLTSLASLIYNVKPTEWKKSKARQALLNGDFETFKQEAFSEKSGFNKITNKQGTKEFISGLQNRRERELARFEEMRVPLG